MSDKLGSPGNVSRETLDKLKAFEALIIKWTKTINLVSQSSLATLWDRHIQDSVQLAGLSDNPEKWIDLGSGGGFPGLVVAIILQQTRPTACVTLIESDKRKSAFLLTAAQKLDVSVEVIPSRIESSPQMHATTLSARALAPLGQLLDYSTLHMLENGTALFMKGQNWENEIRDAQQKWHFEYDVINSTTHAQSAVLKIKNIERKQTNGG